MDNDKKVVHDLFKDMDDPKTCQMLAVDNGIGKLVILRRYILKLESDLQMAEDAIFKFKQQEDV